MRNLPDQNQSIYVLCFVTFLTDSTEACKTPKTSNLLMRDDKMGLNSDRTQTSVQVRMSDTPYSSTTLWWIYSLYHVNGSSLIGLIVRLVKRQIHCSSLQFVAFILKQWLIIFMQIFIWGAYQLVKRRYYRIRLALMRLKTDWSLLYLSTLSTLSTFSPFSTFCYPQLTDISSSHHKKWYVKT